MYAYHPLPLPQPGPDPEAGDSFVAPHTREGYRYNARGPATALARGTPRKSKFHAVRFSALALTFGNNHLRQGRERGWCEIHCLLI